MHSWAAADASGTTAMASARAALRAMTRMTQPPSGWPTAPLAPPDARSLRHAASRSHGTRVPNRVPISAWRDLALLLDPEREGRGSRRELQLAVGRDLVGGRRLERGH